MNKITTDEINTLYKKEDYKGFFDIVKGDFSKLPEKIKDKDNNDFKKIFDLYIELKKDINVFFEKRFIEKKKLKKELLLLPILDNNTKNIIISRFFLEIYKNGLEKESSVLDIIYKTYFEDVYCKKFDNIPEEIFIYSQISLIKDGFIISNDNGYINEVFLKESDYNIYCIYERIIGTKSQKVILLKNKSKENKIITLSNNSLFDFLSLQIKTFSDISTGNKLLEINSTNKDINVLSYNNEKNKFDLGKNKYIFSTIYNTDYIKKELYFVNNLIDDNIKNGNPIITKPNQKIIKDIFKLYYTKIDDLGNFMYNYEKNGGNYFFYNNKILGDNKNYQILFNNISVYKKNIEKKIEKIMSNTNIYKYIEKSNTGIKFNEKIDICINDNKIK